MNNGRRACFIAPFWRLLVSTFVNNKNFYDARDDVIRQAFVKWIERRDKVESNKISFTYLPINSILFFFLMNGFLFYLFLRDILFLKSREKIDRLL